MKTEKEVSIYIPCYNVENTIEECLKGVLSQTYPIEEIMIVDDGSTDSTLEVVEEYPVKIVRHKENRGLAAARNTAIKESKNDFIGSLDADCVPQPEWLEEIMKQFDENVAGVGGRLREKFANTLPDRWRATHLTMAKEEEPVSKKFLSGCNCVYKKSTVEEVGGYDERYKSNFEDVYISKKIRDLGHELVHTPHAIVDHLCEDTFTSVMERAWRYFFSFRLELSSFSEFISKCIFDIGNSAYYSIKDLKEKRPNFLPIDIFLFTQWARLDWKNYIKNRESKRETSQRWKVKFPPFPQSLLSFYHRFKKAKDRSFKSF